MKNRLIVAGIGIPALLAVIFFAPLWGWAIVVAAMAAVAGWELLHTTQGIRFRTRFGVYAAVCAAAIPLGTVFGAGEFVLKLAGWLLMVVMFAEMMLTFRQETGRMHFVEPALAFMGGIVFPFMLTALVRLGQHAPKAPYILLTFVIVWISDSGAFFVGNAMGKHKLAPHLSPNKSIEGAVGGLAAAILGALLYGLILKLCGYYVNFLAMMVYGLLGSVAGQMGDLAFSAIKREYGVKDYSNLLPGHGGMLDRFDSTIFTAPLIELLVILWPAISVIAQ